MGSAPTLGFGFIGAGAIAHFHAQAVAASNGGRAIGVVSRTLATAEKFAGEHGLGFAGDDVEALLRQPGVDAVCITTPSALHLEPALQAIRAGKHLMIEKPIEATVEGTDHILREAEKAGVRIGSIFQARFGGAARAVKAAVEAGRFGRPPWDDRPPSCSGSASCFRVHRAEALMCEVGEGGPSRPRGVCLRPFGVFGALGGEECSR
jgi:predicted dehydrogenase